MHAGPAASGVDMHIEIALANGRRVTIPATLDPGVEAPVACGCCGSARISKMGEDITETLEVIPRRWKVIQTVREKFTRRDCETISQPPAPFHATPRGWAGPNLLATILFEKFVDREESQFYAAADFVPMGSAAIHSHNKLFNHLTRREKLYPAAARTALMASPCLPAR